MAGLLDQFQEGGRQGVLDQLGDLRPAGALGRSAPKLDQVSAGDDADDLASLDHGHLSQTVFHLGQGRGVLIEFGAGGDKVQIGDGEGFRVQDQLGRAETDMARHPPSNPFLQTLGQGYGVSLHHQVQIQGGCPQEKVAHEAAYHVEGRARTEFYEHATALPQVECRSCLMELRSTWGRAVACS